MVSEESEALTRLKQLVRSPTAAAWLAEARVERGPILRVQGPLQKRWFELHASEALAQAFGGPVRVEASSPSAAAEPPRIRVRPQLTGPAGEFAVRAVRAFVEGGPAAAPLVVVHGPVHSGKSTLLEWACTLGGARVFRLDLERVRAGRSRGFVPRKPLVVAEGVERLAGRAAAQRSLCAILDAVHDRGDRALVALEGHPAQCPGLDGALRNRLKGGILVPLAPLGRAELRLQLRERARRRGRRLPRRWENELLALPPALALRALDLRLDGRNDELPELRPPMDRLKDAAARVFAVDRELLEGAGKRRCVVEARRAVIAAACRSGLRPEAILEAFGLSATRTLREACRWSARMAERDRRYAALLHEVERETDPGNW